MFKLFGKKETTASISVMTPMSGVVKKLEDVPDPVFAGKMVGDGFAVDPIEGTVLAPVSGELVQMFPTQHAFGIKTDDGLEVLVHVGIDTVQLKGEGFTAFAAVGDRVEQGQKILEVNLDVLKQAGKSIITPVIITNMPVVETLELTAVELLQTAPTEAAKIILKK